MAAAGLSRPALLLVLASCAAAGTAHAQTTVVAPPPAAPTASAAAATDAGLHDRVLTLVQAHKCGPAHDEAIAGGDEFLAQQVSELCGLKPTRDAGSKGGGGGGGKGGGRKSPGR